MTRYCFLVVILALSGCAAPSSSRLKTKAGYCDPPLAYYYNPVHAPKTDLDAYLTPELLTRYPRRNLLTANAVGILPSLKNLEDLSVSTEGHADSSKELAKLKQRQIILTQLLLVNSTVSSIAAELDCEGERADQVANYLSNLDDKRTQRLNVFSIVIGALSGIGTTISENRRSQYDFGIGGGLIGAGLGILTLSQDGHREDFQHSRNLLTDIWTEKAHSAVWPPSIWYMLTNPAFSNQGKTSIAHNTRDRWQHYSQLENLNLEKTERITALLFDSGGSYSADELKLRSDMLNELQSSVRLLSQELQGLLMVLTED